MRKITLAKPAKEATSSVVLYAYTREGTTNGQCTCQPTPNNNCPCGNHCH